MDFSNFIDNISPSQNLGEALARSQALVGRPLLDIIMGLSDNIMYSSILCDDSWLWNGQPGHQRFGDDATSFTHRRLLLDNSGSLEQDLIRHHASAHFGWLDQEVCVVCAAVHQRCHGSERRHPVGTMLADTKTVAHGIAWRVFATSIYQRVQHLCGSLLWSDGCRFGSVAMEDSVAHGDLVKKGKAWYHILNESRRLRWINVLRQDPSAPSRHQAQRRARVCHGSHDTRDSRKRNHNHRRVYTGTAIVTEGEHPASDSVQLGCSLISN